MQSTVRSQDEEPSSLLRRKIEEKSSLLQCKIEELNRNTVLLIVEAWEIDPRIETAIRYAQVIRKPEHKAEGGYRRIGVISMCDYIVDSQLSQNRHLTH